MKKLKMSSDDGIRMLYLDFGGKDGELVSALCFDSVISCISLCNSPILACKHNTALYLSSI